MSNYRKDIIDHKQKLGFNIKKVIDELYTRQLIHDNDKISDDIIFEAYDKYNDELRALSFEDPKYNILLTHDLGEAIERHSQNRHHFNSDQYSQEFPIDFIDCIEYICDVKSALERDESKSIPQVKQELINIFSRIEMQNLPSANELMVNTIKNIF